MQILPAFIVAVLFTIGCTPLPAEIITVTVTGTTAPTGLPFAGPHSVSGLIVWDSSLPGASSNKADVAWDDPGITTFEFSFTGGSEPFVFNPTTIAGVRGHSESSSVLANATFNLSGAELRLNRNSDHVDSGQHWLALGNDSEPFNSNSTYAIAFMTTVGDGLGGAYNPEGFFGEVYTPITTIHSTAVPEPSCLSVVGLFGLGWIGRRVRRRECWQQRNPTP